MSKPFKRLLITGAAGRLGSVLRKHLAAFADELRLTDIADMGHAAPHEQLVRCDLANFNDVLPLTEGVDAIVHAGGVPVEDTFDKILNGNIVGTYNIYEAARRNGVKRVVYTSPTTPSASTTAPKPSTQPLRTAQTACMASASASPRTWAATTGTSSPSSLSTCASARRSLSHWTGACSPPGCRLTTSPSSPSARCWRRVSGT